MENLHFDLTFEICNLPISQAEQTDGQKWPTLPYKEGDLPLTCRCKGKVQVTIRLRYACFIGLRFLIEHVYLMGAWFGKDQ